MSVYTGFQRVLVARRAKTTLQNEAKVNLGVFPYLLILSLTSSFFMP